LQQPQAPLPERQGGERNESYDDAIAVVCEGLGKTYGTVKAVDGVDLSFDKGEIFGLLGPNGAGKTTIIKMLTTLAAPTFGEARVGGYSITKQPGEVKKVIGWVASEVIVDDDFTAMENLHLQARLQEVKDWKQKANSLLDYFGLQDASERKVGGFSTGMRKKLEIAMALLHSPVVIFMDEPTIGLDVVTRSMLWRLIRDLNKEYGVSVLLTTHYMEEADALCKRIAIINQGKIVAIGEPEKLKTKFGGDVLELELATTSSLDLEAMRSLKAVEDIKHTDNKLIITLAPGEGNVMDVLRSIDLANVKGMKLQRPSLDSVFLKLTGMRLEDAEQKVDFRRFYTQLRRNR
jgi:ABC-2 type transport system ATP-binding protein